MSFPFPTSRFAFADRAGLPVWPDGKKLAVLVYTAPEEWLWDEREPFVPPATYAAGARPLSLSARSGIDYGYTVGLRRLREVYRQFGMKVTLWTNGNSVETHRDVLEELAADGHEIGAHAYSEGQPMSHLDAAEQKESVARTTELITDLTGAPPKGWIGPIAEATADTIELLAGAGYHYNADLQDDELPYFLHASGRWLVVIPYRKIGNINDLPLFARNVQSVSSGIAHLKEAFDAYHREAQTRPLVFNYGTHPHVSGRPDNAYVLAKFLEYVHEHDDVWVTSYAGISDWWKQRYESLVPPGGGDLPPGGVR
ncbi:MAG TPA: polysaccharide deacetylase family protein [Actinophytocola sp.]|jgi:peptidoglycan/xylan/chitin deacetylase (PgdA/CDA1 family)|nr:polysaccharide deacetylase family protein [Actinophytocola sp.]